MQKLCNTTEQQCRQEISKDFFTGTSDSYESVVNFTTLGADYFWKARMFDICYSHVKNPKNILDLACGTGLITFGLSNLYPEAKIACLDVTPEYLAIAKSKLSESTKDRIAFIHDNADNINTENLRKYGTFDIIISSYLPKYVDLSRLMINLDTFLADNGLIIFHDFTSPQYPPFKALYDAYWAPLEIVLHYSQWNEASKNLKQLADESTWVDDFITTAQRLGYKDVTKEYQLLEASAITYATKGDT